MMLELLEPGVNIEKHPETHPVRIRKRSAWCTCLPFGLMQKFIHPDLEKISSFVSIWKRLKPFHGQDMSGCCSNLFAGKIRQQLCVSFSNSGNSPTMCHHTTLQWSLGSPGPLGRFHKAPAKVPKVKGGSPKMELPNVPLHTEEVEEEDRHGRNEPKESGGCSGDDRGGVPADGRPLVGILQMVFNAAVLLMSCVQNSTVTLVQVLFSCICCANRYPSHSHFFEAHFRDLPGQETFVRAMSDEKDDPPTIEESEGQTCLSSILYLLWVVKVERFQWNERPSCAHATSKVDQCCVQLVSSKLVFFSFWLFRGFCIASDFVWLRI